MKNNKVISSAKYVVDNANFVKINLKKIREFAQEFKCKKVHHWLLDSPFNLTGLNTEEKIMLVVVFNAISFSYWGKEYWNITYKDKNYKRGSTSLLACIFRAREEGQDILDPNVLSKLTKSQLKFIWRGNVEIAMIDERVKILNEIGRVLLEKFDGKFSNVIKKANKDTIKLIEIILQNFPHFRDNEVYKSKRIYFNKRVQALVEGIGSLFSEYGVGELENLSSITALADYIIPNFLRHLGIFEYQKNLIRKIDHKIELKKGSQEEIEIRAGTIWAVELIKRELALNKIYVNSTNINEYLWAIGRNATTPFHLTRTTSY